MKARPRADRHCRTQRTQCAAPNLMWRPATCIQYSNDAMLSLSQEKDLAALSERMSKRIKGKKST